MNIYTIECSDLGFEVVPTTEHEIGETDGLYAPYYELSSLPLMYARRLCAYCMDIDESEEYLRERLSDFEMSEAAVNEIIAAYKSDEAERLDRTQGAYSTDAPIVL